MALGVGSGLTTRANLGEVSLNLEQSYHHATNNALFSQLKFISFYKLQHSLSKGKLQLLING